MKMDIQILPYAYIFTQIISVAICVIFHNASTFERFLFYRFRKNKVRKSYV